MLIVYSFTSLFSIVVNTFAVPKFMFFGSATLYNFLLGSVEVYLPNIPDCVFSWTFPYILELSYFAFFSPGLPLSDGVMLVTVAS